MKKIDNILYYIVTTVATLVAIGSTLSAFQDTESRFLKMLDFPRIQFFVTAVLCLFIFSFLTKKWKWYDYLFIAFMVLGMVVQSSYIYSYTPLASKTVPTAPDITDAADRVSMLIINVKMSNRKSQPLLQLIQEQNPDLVLAMEVNEWWDEALRPISKEYPHTKESINDLGYGMTLYSKHQLQEITVNNLHNERIPSFSSTITLANNKNIRVHTLHPPPPLHYKDLPDNEGQQEQALLDIGDKVKKSKLPTIVMGDFNDVAWSKTKEMMGARGQLNDVRTGRWFYNSYHVDKWWLRYPLDHCMVTEDFSLRRLERMPDIGSDHFPIFVELVLED